MEFLTDFHQLHGVWRHHCSTTAESWLNLQQPEKYCLFWYPNTWVVTCHVETNCCNISPKNFWWQTSTLAHKNLISWGHSDGHHAKSGLKEMLERHRNSRSILAWLLFYMSPLQLMDIHWYTEHMYIYTVRQRNKKHLWCHTSQVHRMILSLNEISRMKKITLKNKIYQIYSLSFPSNNMEDHETKCRKDWSSLGCCPHYTHTSLFGLMCQKIYCSLSI